VNSSETSTLHPPESPSAATFLPREHGGAGDASSAITSASGRSDAIAHAMQPSPSQIDHERPRAARQEVQRPLGEELRLGRGTMASAVTRTVTCRNGWLRGCAAAARRFMRRLSAATYHPASGASSVRRGSALSAPCEIRRARPAATRIDGRAFDARAPQRVGPDGEGRLDARPRVDQRVRIHGAPHDSTFCSRSACSAAVARRRSRRGRPRGWWQAVQGEPDPVIGHAALAEVVGADPLAALGPVPTWTCDQRHGRLLLFLRASSSRALSTRIAFARS